MKQIRNIIFDWGGVITSIDFDATIDAFNALGVDDFGKHYRKDFQSLLFQLLEAGQISEGEFRKLFRETIYPDISDTAMDKAWFAMLKETPKENIEYLRNLGSKYRIYLLSNTNSIHVDLYDQILKEEFELAEGLRVLFNKAYYSHEIGFLKPSQEIFQYVLDDAVLNPQETLFIDDSIPNIQAAKKLGINCIHFKGDSLLSVALEKILYK